MRGFDLWGHLLGGAVAHRLKTETQQGGGALLNALKPVLTELVQAEVNAQVNKQINKAGGFINKTTGIGNLAGLLDPGIAAPPGNGA